MKGRLLLVGDRAVALLVDGRLDEVLSRRPAPAPAMGAQYLGRVGRLLGGGAFLELGENAGFLPDASGLSAGDQRIVEIARPPDGSKAARLTQRLTYRGRLAALTVGAPGVNVSRKITDTALRAQLLDAATAAAPEAGLVVRSAAAKAGPTALSTEIAVLEARRTEVATRAAARIEPGRVMDAPSALHIALADWTRAAPDQILVPWADIDTVKQVVQENAPEFSPRLEPVEGDPLDLADAHAAIDALLAPDVPLTSGSMILERTAALISVDVNAGEGARERANRAAATELPRQLRLRGWAGQVVVDFAGAPDPKERSALETAIRRAADPALRLAGWGPLGLLEATRRYDRPPLADTL